MSDSKLLSESKGTASNEASEGESEGSCCRVSLRREAKAIGALSLGRLAGERKAKKLRTGKDGHFAKAWLPKKPGLAQSCSNKRVLFASRGTRTALRSFLSCFSSFLERGALSKMGDVLLPTLHARLGWTRPFQVKFTKSRRSFSSVDEEVVG